MQDFVKQAFMDGWRKAMDKIADGELGSVATNDRDTPGGRMQKSINEGVSNAAGSVMSGIKGMFGGSNAADSMQASINSRPGG